MPTETVYEVEGHWVGKTKSRYDFTLKLLEQKSTTRGYWVYRMKDKYGNLFIAFDGRPEWLVDNHLIKEEEGTITDDDETVSVHPLVNGDCFTCKATVNRHDKANFKYGGPDSEHKQTVLNRIKLGKFVE